MKTCILVFLAACLAVSMAAPYWGFPYGRYGDENNDLVPDVYDNNRDGKVDGPYYRPYYNGLYTRGYGYPGYGFRW